MPKSEKVVVELPSPLADELIAASQEMLADLLERGLRDLRIERALERYKRGGTSLAAAAESAGISQSELARAAYVRNIEPPYDNTMLAEEVA